MNDWKAVGRLDSGGSKEGARPPLIFSSNWSPKGRKKFFRDRPARLSEGLDRKEMVGEGGGGAYELWPLEEISCYFTINIDKAVITFQNRQPSPGNLCQLEQMICLLYE